MLTFEQDTKQKRFLNRNLMQLKRLRRTRLPSIEYLVNRENNTKTLDPDSGIAIILSTSNRIMNSIIKRINYNDININNPWKYVREASEKRLCKKQREFDETSGIRIESSNALQLQIQTLDVVNRLEQSGIHPDDIQSLIDTKNALRRSYNDTDAYAVHNALSFSDKIRAYKRKWDTVNPDQLSQYIPYGQAIGVEIEWIAAAELTENSDGEDYYDRDVMDFVKPTESNLRDGRCSQYIYGTSWGYDSSIDPKEEHQYCQGQEVRVMLKRGVWDRLRKTCQYIKASGGELNKNCGLHVHLDVRDLSLAAAKTRGRRLEAALPWLLSLVPKSRRNNSYCKSRFSTEDKYAAISMSQFRYRKSIEVRLHSATLNATKIINWIDLLYFLKERYTMLPTFEDFLNAPDAPAHLKEWAINRKNKFAPPVEPEQDVESEQITELPDPVDAGAAAGLPPLPPSMDR